MRNQTAMAAALVTAVSSKAVKAGKKEPAKVPMNRHQRRRAEKLSRKGGVK